MAWTQISIYRFAFDGFDKSPQDTQSLRAPARLLSKLLQGFPFCDGVSALLATCLKGYNSSLGPLLVEESPINFYVPHAGCAAEALFDT